MYTSTYCAYINSSMFVTEYDIKYSCELNVFHLLLHCSVIPSPIPQTS